MNLTNSTREASILLIVKDHFVFLIEWVIFYISRFVAVYVAHVLAYGDTPTLIIIYVQCYTTFKKKGTQHGIWRDLLNM